MTRPFPTAPIVHLFWLVLLSGCAVKPSVTSEQVRSKRCTQLRNAALGKENPNRAKRYQYTQGVMTKKSRLQADCFVLPKKVIERAVRSHQDDVLRCYQRFVQVQCATEMRLHIKVTLRNNGTVQNAYVSKRSFFQPQFEVCLRSKIQSWKFPSFKHNKPFSFEYPFLFSTQQ